MVLVHPEAQTMRFPSAFDHLHEDGTRDLLIMMIVALVFIVISFFHLILLDLVQFLFAKPKESCKSTIYAYLGVNLILHNSFLMSSPGSSAVNESLPALYYCYFVFIFGLE